MCSGRDDTSTSTASATRLEWARPRGAFLTPLAVERDVTASTQSQALSALLFLYREVLHLGLPWLAEVTRAKKPARLPTVLTRAEAQGLLDCGFQDDSYPRANRSWTLGHPCR